MNPFDRMNSLPSRVIIVDDHQIVLDSLSLLLTSFEHIQVVGKFTNGAAAIEFYREHGADLIVTDMRMPGMSGVELCKEVRKVNPDATVLMLTMVEDARQIREAIKVGVNGYVLKMADAGELLLSIRTVLKGRKYFSEQVIVELAVGRDEAITNKPGTFVKLTLRELEILRLVGKELSTSEIAEKLFISVPTVETHRRNIMQKIGAKSVVGLVLFAVKHELLD